MIVWLASYPRSGNTFFRVLLKHLYGITTYSIYNDPLLEELGAADVVGHERLPAPLAELDAAQDVSFVKTHDLPSDDKPAVYLVRDGRDSLVSWGRYLQSFKRLSLRKKLAQWVWSRVLRRDLFADQLERVIMDTSMFGGWGPNVLAWLHRPAGKTVILRYEDLTANPIQSMQKAITGLGLDIPPVSDKVPSFEELHVQWPAFFRKGKVGAWREEMPEQLHQLFWARHGDAMRQLGYVE